MITRKILGGFWVALFFGCAGCGSLPPGDISLAGTWRFAIDSTDAGMTEKWFEQTLPQTISLPGSMAENDLGDIPGLTTRWTGTIYDSSWFFDPRLAKYRRPGKVRFPFWLTPRRHYVGPAWYQQTVVIPESWANQAVILHLERPHWETTVWVDTHLLGTQNSLSAPHVFELGRDLQPGPHTVTIRVDNRIKDINVGPDSHSLTDHTQGNWNGIAGDIRLETRPDFYIDDVQVYPDIHRQSATVRVTLGNSGGDSFKAAINLSARSFNSPNAHSPAPQTHEFQIFSRDTTLEFTYPLGEGVLLWDEFDPALYRLSVSVSDPTGQSDAKIVQFGMREFAVSGTRFAVNGKTTFLRGTVECAAFPHTGYPPTDVPSWERIFKICREHGLNHMRFHSWCPPEAAFIAADKIGFYLQPEGPSWANHGSSIGDGNPIDQYIFDETERILRAYGNHPSLVMMAYGNEPAGENQVEYLGNYVNHFKAKDPRRLYTGASIARSWPVVPESEFIVRSEPRGLPWNRMPQSRFDYRDKIAPYPVPYVTHEMGQFCVFPDFSEIAQYSGVYQARNFQLFQEDLADHHMGDQARDFLMASGKLQALCYKSEIEAALRTPGSAGIQLLGLNDFPGQGTALVGVLNVFWGEKGYITPGEFRRFCNSTVALARLPKFVFTSAETLQAQIEVAHFGPEILRGVEPKWTIIREDGEILFEGLLPATDILPGNGMLLGELSVSLSGISAATRLKLQVDIAGFRNDWDVWVYPAALPPAESEIHVSSSLDQEAKNVLQKGGKVLLLGAGKVQNGKDVVQYFRPVFWNTSWFQMRPPHTLGILCDPEHPVFADFPTDFHSNLQWWEILQRQQVMNLEQFPPAFRPLVQPIDTWFLNRRLGLLLEVRVGEGKLMVCSADLQSDPQARVAARQLLYSIKRYMASEQFNPAQQVDLAVIEDLFTEKNREKLDIRTSDSPDELKPKLKPKP